MHDNLTVIMAEAIEENRKGKICLIEDIIKAKKFLFSQGQDWHNEFIKPETAGALFDELYEMSHEKLTGILNAYINQINQIVRNQILP